jgi:hypothetical protein
MTDTTRLALALNELAAAILELSSGDAGGSPSPSVTSSPPASAAPSPAAAFAAAQPRPQTGGACPTHGTPWTYKEAGTSKAGKHYDGFWKCDGKLEDGSFCKEKPGR